MTIRRIPFRMREIEFLQDFKIDACSSQCLLLHRKLVLAIPAAFGGGAQDNVKTALFQTPQGSIIKRKPKRWIGSPQYESDIKKRISFTKGLVKLIDACECSVEMTKEEGAIVKITQSPHYRSLGSKYTLRTLSDFSEIKKFYSQALEITNSLRSNGLLCIDPAYWNFLFNGEKTVLIDLDSIFKCEEFPEELACLKFIEFFLSPLLRLPLDDFSRGLMVQQFIESQSYISNELLSGFLDMANRLSETSIEHMKASTGYMHANMIREESERTYNKHLKHLRSELKFNKDEIEKKSCIKDNEIAELKESLINKESEIIELSKAITAYGIHRRKPIYKRIIAKIPQLLSSSLLRFRTIFAPRLGRLYQYQGKQLAKSNAYNLRKPLRKVYKDLPSISIITPSYQQGHFIERTILSVLNQYYPNLQYFVQDGGSQDFTVSVLKQFENKLSGWASAKDSGQSQAINLGLSHTDGEIMAWLNSDDLLLPGALHTVADYFNRHPDVDVVYGNRLMIDENDMEIGRWILPGHNSDVLSWVDYVPQETLFWRRRIWEKVGRQVDESFRFAMDWDLLVRFRDAGAKFRHIPQFLGAFRVHERQKTSAAINEIGHREMDRIRERILGRVPDHKEIRKAVLPYLIKHIAVDIGYRVKQRLRKKA
jgi:glycosyltransferase involved in cell wall biosynthesis